MVERRNSTQPCHPKSHAALRLSLTGCPHLMKWSSDTLYKEAVLPRNDGEKAIISITCTVGNILREKRRDDGDDVCSSWRALWNGASGGNSVHFITMLSRIIETPRAKREKLHHTRRQGKSRPVWKMKIWQFTRLEKPRLSRAGAVKREYSRIINRLKRLPANPCRVNESNYKY